MHLGHVGCGASAKGSIWISFGERQRKEYFLFQHQTMSLRIHLIEMYVNGVFSQQLGCFRACVFISASLTRSARRGVVAGGMRKTES